MADDNAVMLLCVQVILFCLAVTVTLHSPAAAVSPVTAITHSLKNHVIMALGESETSVINNACNLFNQNPTTSVLLLWDDQNKDFVVFDGEQQEVTNNTLLHVVGHGGEASNEKRPVQLGGRGPEELAWMVSKLPIHDQAIGHISLVACYIHRRADGNDSFLQLFLSALVAHYNIVTSVSAWTMEVAVDAEGRLVSRFNSTSSWLLDYPGSVVVASLRWHHRDDLIEEYNTLHDGGNSDLEQVDHQRFTNTAATGAVEHTADKPWYASSLEAAADSTEDHNDGQQNEYHLFKSDGNSSNADDGGTDLDADTDQFSLTVSYHQIAIALIATLINGVIIVCISRCMR